MQSINFQGKAYPLETPLDEIGASHPLLVEAMAVCRAWASNQTSFSLSTSGSTGTPKMQVFNRAQIEASARMTIEHFGLSDCTGAFLCCLSPSKVAGFMMLVRAVQSGKDIVLTEPAANPFEGLSDTCPAIDFAALVPYQLQTVLDTGQTCINALNKVKSIIVGGAAVSIHLEEEIRNKLSVPVFATFGMTETLSHVAVRQINGSSPTESFRLLPGVKINTDHRACLVLSAPSTLGETIYTNDLVEAVSADAFIWKGRYDNIINSGGIKIQAEKVERAAEKAFAALGFRPKLFAFGVKDEKFGQKNILFVEMEELEIDGIDFLNTKMSNELEKYEIPKKIYFVNNFIYTDSSKIDRIKTANLFNGSYHPS